MSAFREVQRGDVIDIKKDIPSNVHHEGVYLGSKHITTDLGGQFIYKFKKADNKVFGIWGFTTLNSAMENVNKGSLCRVTYKGQAEEKNKYGKYLHLVKVEVDDEFQVSVDDIEDSEVPF